MVDLRIERLKEIKVKENNYKEFYKGLILILLIFGLMPNQVKGGEKEKTITLVFRFDDYSSRSPTDLELKILDAFKKCRLPVTFGVIPYVYAQNANDDSRQPEVMPLNPSKTSILRSAVRAGILEVALHGCSHQTIEFSGLEANEQLQRISKGRNLLEEILDLKIHTFIPPWNSYDLITIKALERLGFKSISANSYGVKAKASPLKFLPYTCNLTALEDTIRSARRISDDDAVIVVLFHHSDFIEHDRAKGKFAHRDFIKLLAWVASQKDVHVCTIDDATRLVKDLGARRFLEYSAFISSRRYRILPNFLKKPHITRVYLSTCTIRDIKVRYGLLFVLSCFISLIVLVAVAAWVRFYLFSRFRN